MKAQEVEIMIGGAHTWIRFRDDWDIDHNGYGRVYHMFRPARLRRLTLVLRGWWCEMRIDGMTPYFVFRRPAPLMLPESDR